jgi:hypothetical protein
MGRIPRLSGYGIGQGFGGKRGFIGDDDVRQAEGQGLPGAGGRFPFRLNAGLAKVLHIPEASQKGQGKADSGPAFFGPDDLTLSGRLFPLYEMGKRSRYFPRCFLGTRKKEGVRLEA